MKYFVLVMFLLVVSVPVLAQQDEQRKVDMPDNVMKEVVSRVLTWYFKPRTKSKKIYLSNDLIKQEWLPEIKNIEFVIEPENTDRLYYLFGPIERKGNNFDINFGRFTGCRENCCYTTGDTWRFRVIGKRVRLFQASSGWGGSGCGWG